MKHEWWKPVVVGALGSLVMFVVLMVGIHVSGTAPFNIPPSAAFLEKIGWNVGPLPLLVHFGYGAFWSFILVYLFRDSTDVKKGLGLGVALWLLMMLVYSPIIGWGVLGFGGRGSELPENAALYLEPGPKYAVATLVLHLIYGAIVGWLNSVWVRLGEPMRRLEERPAEF